MPNFQQQVQRRFNQSAHRYDEHAALQREVARHLFATAETDFNKHGRWLDIGCGTGFLQELMRSHQYKNTLLQLDISPAMCEVASSYASDAEYGQTFTLAADMMQLPFAKNTLDGVISSLALQWSNPLDKALANIANILCTSGVFHASIMAEGSLQELCDSYHHLGREAPVIEFVNQPQLTDVAAAYFTDIKAQPQRLTYYYKNVRALLKSLKAIGANYTGSAARPINKHFIEALESHYQSRYGGEKGVAVTWNILYLEGKKK